MPHFAPHLQAARQGPAGSCEAPNCTAQRCAALSLSLPLLSRDCRSDFRTTRRCRRVRSEMRVTVQFKNPTQVAKCPKSVWTLPEQDSGSAARKPIHAKG